MPFRDFMELALYDPDGGYYATRRNPIGRAADYVTAPLLSPVFGFALGRLVAEFLRRVGDGLSTVVDIGCGDGRLIHSLYGEAGSGRDRARWFGVDRTLLRADPLDPIQFVGSIEEVQSPGPRLILSNELFDALPFARLVQRTGGLHELWVTTAEGELSWSERPAPAEYVRYLEARNVELAEGQFADLSLEWDSLYRSICRQTPAGIIVTFDYGYPEDRLFRFRRFGTAAAYSEHRVTRDLLARPGEQDLTAHINFTDLIRAGEEEGFETLFFDRQARFLLALGATEHPLLQPLEEVSSIESGLEILQQRQDAKRLVLPDDIGNDIRVLVQSRGVESSGWSFQRKLF